MYSYRFRFGELQCYTSTLGYYLNKQTTLCCVKIKIVVERRVERRPQVRKPQSPRKDLQVLIHQGKQKPPLKPRPRNPLQQLLPRRGHQPLTLQEQPALLEGVKQR